MKNPIADKKLSLDTLGMLWILHITYKMFHGTEPWQRITRKEVELAMKLKLGLDKYHDAALTRLARAGYILQENEDGTIYISLL